MPDDIVKEIDWWIATVKELPRTEELLTRARDEIMRLRARLQE